MATKLYPEKLTVDDYERIKSPDHINPDGAQYLVEAIIQKAADDWRTAAGALRRRPTNVVQKNDILKKRKEECEEFFKSNYFGILTSIDGEALLAALRKELDDKYGKVAE